MSTIEEHHQQDFDLFSQVYNSDLLQHPSPTLNVEQDEAGDVPDILEIIMSDEDDEKELFELENADPEFWNEERKKIVSEVTEMFFREHVEQKTPVLFTDLQNLLLERFQGEENQDDVRKQVEKFVKEIKGFYMRVLFQAKQAEEGGDDEGNEFFVQTTWRNHISNVVVHPERLVSVQDANDLVAVLNEGGKIKAHGSGHSYSSVCQTTGTLIDLSQMDRVIKEPVEDPVTGKWYLEVETGIKLHTLVAYLKKNGFALLNLGGYDGQTLAGVISTATHGSGISIGSFSDMVRVATIATNGDLSALGNAENQYFYRITTSTEKFFEREGDIKNDDLLNAVVCSFGSMGLLYSVVLEVQKLYYIYQKTEFVDTESLLENNESNLQARLTANNSSNRIELWTHPYSGKALVVTRELRTKPPKSGLFKKFIEGITDLLKKIGMPILRLSGLQFSHPDLFKQATLATLRSQNGTEVWSSYEHILLTGLGRNAGFAFELSIPISDGNGNLDLTNLSTLIRVSTNYLVNIDPSHPIPMFSVRFVAESNALVAMNSGTQIATIEYQMINPILEKNRQVLIDYLTTFEQYLLDNEEVSDKLVIHWGLDFDRNNAQHFDRFAKSGTWKQLYASVNSQGSFSNKLTQQLDLDDENGLPKNE